MTPNLLSVTCPFTRSRTAPMRWRSGFEIKSTTSPKIIATFSRHTCFPMFIGMTADRCDILVSLSPNLKRFFSRTFSTDARSFEVSRSRYCLNVSDPLIILAHPVSTIPSHSSSALLHAHLWHIHAQFSVSSLSPAMNNAVFGICESCPAESSACSRRNTENAIHAVGSSHRNESLFQFSWRKYPFFLAE